MAEPSFLVETRVAYDTVAAAYAERVRTELADRPLDRALLSAFAEFVQLSGGGKVVDVGCGPGHVSGYLNQAGLAMVGLDLSATMLGQARRLHPGLGLAQASMTALPLGDGLLAGLVAWYSTIHVPTDHLDGVFAEFHRVVRPGGIVVLGFQVGDECRQIDQAYGHDVSVVAYRRQPELIAQLLKDAGFNCLVQSVRQPDPDETVAQACLMARKGEAD